MTAAGLFAGVAGLLAALAALSHGPPAPVWRLVALASAAHVPYLALLAVLARLPLPRLRYVLIAAAALRAVLVAGQPVFSDDVYRYVLDGRVVAAGMDPYALPPAAEELAAFRDDDFARINHPELRTIYPPLAEAAFGAIAAVWPSATAFRIAAALADLGVVWLVVLVTRRREGGGARAGAFAGLAYGLNPLACIETAMSGHLEPLAVLPAIGAIAILTRTGGGERAAAARRIAAGVLIGVGACVKLLPALLLAPAARRLRAAVLIAPAAVLAVYAACWSPDLGAVRTLDAFARRWEGNAGGFALLKLGADGIIGAASGAELPADMVHVRILDAPARALQGGFFSLHKDGGFDPDRPGAFARSDLALAAAKIAAGLLLLAAIIWVCRRGVDPPSAALWIFGAFVLLTPVLHPWYLLWVLPWAACRRAWPWLVFGAALPLAYLPLDRWWADAVWDAPPWIPIAEHGLLAAAAVWFLARRRSGPC